MTREEKTLNRIRRDAIRIRELIDRVNIEKLSHHDVVIETFIQAVEELIEEGNQCKKL